MTDKVVTVALGPVIRRLEAKADAYDQEADTIGRSVRGALFTAQKAQEITTHVGVAVGVAAAYRQAAALLRNLEEGAS